MNKKKISRIVITPGEPAGIGPDIVIMIAQKKWPVELVICGDAHLLLNRAKKLKLPLKLKNYSPKQKISPNSPGELSILQIPLITQVIPGELNVKNNNYVINTLNKAAEGCINKEFSALVTGPVHKAILNMGGVLFSGHTEFLSQHCKCNETVMMLTNKKFRVALMTTHIPISSVPQKITPQSLYEKITILSEGLKKYFKILHPKIYVCGLNPHAGENGFIGKEELNILIPTIKKLNKIFNHNIAGPFSADTIFQSKYIKNSDVILTMYHDQGLPVLKFSGFKNIVNITFGLPYIRTSVGHGSALKLSGSKIAKPDSLKQAILTAIHMINNYHEKNIL